MNELLTNPPPTHLVYIPFTILIGFVMGFVVGRKAGMKAGEAEMLGAGGDDDLL